MPESLPFVSTIFTGAGAPPPARTNADAPPRRLTPRARMAAGPLRWHYAPTPAAILPLPPRLGVACPRLGVAASRLYLSSEAVTRFCSFGTMRTDDDHGR